MSNFINEDYRFILSDCLHDIFYVDTSYRGKIAQIRLFSEIIVRKLIDYKPEDQLTLGDSKVLKTVRKLTNGSHYENCILSIKNDTNDYYAANSCSHSKVLAQITQDDYSTIYDHLLNLVSCIFIQHFSQYSFGTNSKVVRCFSLLPPIIRFKVLSFLYSIDNKNAILINKLVLVTLKEFGPDKAMLWIEENKQHLQAIPTIALENMYQNSINIVKTNIKSTYKTMEEAKSFYNHNKADFENDNEEEIQQFLQLMDFIYTGRKEDQRIKPSKYVLSFHNK